MWVIGAPMHDSVETCRCVVVSLYGESGAIVVVVGRVESARRTSRARSCFSDGYLYGYGYAMMRDEEPSGCSGSDMPRKRGGQSFRKGKRGYR